MTTACVVAVVVAYHPNPSQLAQLLAALAPQVAHTVCVDNTNGLPPATRQPDAHTTHLQLGCNTGIAHAQNLGLAQARQLGATHVLLMDQDSQPPPDLVAQLLAGWRYVEHRQADTDHAGAPSPAGTQPRLAAIGPLCRDEKTGRLMPLIQRQGTNRVLVQVPGFGDSTRLKDIISTTARLTELPDVPTVAETFPGFEAVTWAVFCVNAGTPPANTARLAEAINRVTAMPAVRERLLAAGTQPVGDSTPASSRSYWLAEHAKWRDVIRTVGIKLE